MKKTKNVLLVVLGMLVLLQLEACDKKEDISSTTELNATANDNLNSRVILMNGCGHFMYRIDLRQLCPEQVTRLRERYIDSPTEHVVDHGFNSGIETWFLSDCSILPCDGCDSDILEDGCDTIINPTYSILSIIAID